MNIEIITKEEFNQLQEQIRRLDEKLDQLSQPVTKIVKGRQLRQFLGGISESALTNLRSKRIIPFMLVERTYYYDLPDVLKALKEHERRVEPIENPSLVHSKPPPPMNLLNLNFRNPLQ